MDNLVMRLMTNLDLEAVVAIHLQSFPGFFLTFLGPKFLSLLYKSILNDHEGIVIIASADERIEGFVAGVIRQSGFYWRLIEKRKWSFALAAFGGLLRKPSIAPRLIRALKRPQESRSASAEACLMSMAVRPESQGKGIGKQLVRAFCQTLAERGVKALCLTTDQENNEQVKRFYQTVGFQVVRTYTTPEGRVMNEYMINLVE
jgi:ribosomal protein S18 acetylase RimI-like enzyme